MTNEQLAVLIFEQQRGNPQGEKPLDVIYQNVQESLNQLKTVEPKTEYVTKDVKVTKKG